MPPLFEVRPFDDVAVVAERLRSLVFGVASRALERIGVVSGLVRLLVERIVRRFDFFR